MGATAEGTAENATNVQKTWWRDALVDIEPLDVVLGAMIVFGVYVRAQHLSIPHALKWDEHHYVETARSYLHHKYAWNDHPPLSKLVIMTFMQVLGDRPLAWRLPSLLFGYAGIALIGWLTRLVFASRRAGFIASALVAADGFFIAYSRTALLDGMIVACSVASVISMLTARGLRNVLLAGFFAGCAVSFKLNGLVFVALCTAMCLASRELRKYTPLLLAVIATVFYAQCAWALINVGRSGTIAAVIAENRAMVHSHLSYTVVHPYSSKWFTWFLPLRPIFLRHDTDVDGTISALLTLGNPLLWWGSSVAVIAAFRTPIQTGVKSVWEQLQKGAAWLTENEAADPEATDLKGRSSAILWTLAAWAGPVVFWFPQMRDSYIYHYLPSYTFALVLLAGLVERAYRKDRLFALGMLLVAFEVSLFYVPLWGEFPITRSALNARLLKIWH